MIPSNFLSPTPKKSPLEIFGIDLSSNKPRSGIDISKLNLTSTPNKPISGIDISKLNLTSAPNKPIPGIDISKLNLTSTPDKTILDKFRTRTVTPITPPLTQTNRRDISVKHYDQATSCSPLHIILNDQLVDSETTETDEEASNLKSTLENLKNKQLQWFDRQSDEVKEGLRHKVWYNRGGKDNSSFGGDNYGEITIKANPGVLFEGSPGSSSILDLDQYLLDLNQYLLEQKQQREALEKALSTTSSEAAQINAFIAEKAVNLTSAANRISALISEGRQSEILINNFNDFIKNEVNETIDAITSKLNNASETNPEITILKEKLGKFHLEAGKIVEEIGSRLDRKLEEIKGTVSDSDDEEIPRLDGSDSEERTHEISDERTAIQNFISEGKKIQDNSKELFKKFNQLSDETKKALAIEVWQRHDGTEYVRSPFFRGPFFYSDTYGIKVIENDPYVLFESPYYIIDKYLSELEQHLSEPNQVSDTGSDTDEKTSLETSQPIALFKENWDNFASEAEKISSSILLESNPQELKVSYSGFLFAMGQIYGNIESRLNDKSKTDQENAFLEVLYTVFISKVVPIANGIDFQFNKKLEAIENAASDTDEKTSSETNQLTAFSREIGVELGSETQKIRDVISSDLNQKWDTNKKSQVLNRKYNEFVNEMTKIRGKIESKLKKIPIADPAHAPLLTYYKAFLTDTRKFEIEVHRQVQEKIEEIKKVAPNIDIGRATSPNRNLDERVHGSPQEITISDENIERIHNFVMGMLGRDKTSALEMLKAGYPLTILEQTYPGLNFVIAKEGQFEYSPHRSRYEAMIDAQAVINTHKLGLLVIPNAKVFQTEIEGGKYEIFAERKLDTTPFLNEQEQHDQGYANSLDETIRQLAVFICKTGFSNVKKSLIPILNNNVDQNRKIALIDVNEMRGSSFEGAAMGLFGNEGVQRTGLVDHVNEKQAQLIKIVAAENKISIQSFADAEKRRKTSSAEAKLRAYYAEKNIVKGDEILQVNEKEINFSRDFSEIEVDQLQSCVREVVIEINNQISRKSLSLYISPTKSQRTININCDKNKTFRTMDSVLIDEDLHTKLKGIYPDDRATLLGHALHVLADSRFIHKFQRTQSGYTIQA